jgi:ribosomal protein S18 acetylase RimI-like enzyme
VAYYLFVWKKEKRVSSPITDDGYMFVPSKHIIDLPKSFKNFIIQGINNLNPPFEENINHISNKIQDSDFLFRTIAKTPVGMLRFYRIDKHPDPDRFPAEYQHSQMIYVSSVFIDPKYRKKGYGSALFSKLFEKYPRQYICLEVLKNSSAVQFYQKLDFVVKDSIYAQSWLMVKHPGRKPL